MVCLGNICRSPMADGLLRKKVSQHKLDCIVDSAGTSAVHEGQHPDLRMIELAKKMSTPIDTLVSRPFTVADFDAFDSIFVMDKSNFRNVVAMARTDADKKKVDLILNQIHPGMDFEVPDPYYGGEQGFMEVYNLLDEATDKIVEKVLKRLKG
jgi:protein-tyrosine phosphatase